MPSVVKIPRAKNVKLKSEVGMARSPVLHRQKQSSHVLRHDMWHCRRSSPAGRVN